MATTESVAEEDTMQAAVGVQASKSVTVAKVGRVIEIEGIALHDVEVMGECQSIGIEAGSSGFHRAQWKRKAFPPILDALPVLEFFLSCKELNYATDFELFAIV
ncbi:hypothetical protein ACOSQ2_015298 [Xanthoceras sorbifolium]